MWVLTLAAKNCQLFSKSHYLKYVFFFFCYHNFTDQNQTFSVSFLGRLKLDRLWPFTSFARKQKNAALEYFMSNIVKTRTLLAAVATGKLSICAAQPFIRGEFIQISVRFSPECCLSHHICNILSFSICARLDWLVLICFLTAVILTGSCCSRKWFLSTTDFLKSKKFYATALMRVWWT